MHIIDDDAVKTALDWQMVVKRLEATFLSRSLGATVSPPRFAVDGGQGALVFTVGAESRAFHTIGFRVYDTFAGRTPAHRQLVVVYDNRTGALKGIVVGDDVGAIRTAGINAVAIDHLARRDARTVGVIGAGFQADFHLQAACAVRPITHVKLFSRTADKAHALAARWRERGLVERVEVCTSAREAASDVSILLCTTNSRTPVFEAKWVSPGTHVNTIGPKFAGAHELPIALAARASVICTDSIDQIDGYPRPFFLDDTPDRARMVELADLVAKTTTGRETPEAITLFCSVGLSGTEVVVADGLLDAHAQIESPADPAV